MNRSRLSRASRQLLQILLLAMVLGASASAPAALPPPAGIEVVEAGTGWPVPLIEFRTTHHLRFVTDNAGRIAVDAPEVLGRECWFDVVGHGYEIPKDGFGYRGVRLELTPGRTARVEVKRTAIARRLGRLTGAGQYAETERLGLAAEPDSAPGVFGCDSVQNAVHRGRMFWFWGDTTLPHYPLGVFDMTGATTDLRPLTSLEPPLKLRFDLFRDERGRPRGTARMPGPGPTWITGVASVPDATGTPRLVCTYMKIKPPLDAYECGLGVWDEAASTFRQSRVLWNQTNGTPRPPPLPEGHPVRWKDSGGREWLLFGDPFPALRCPATFEAWQDPATWESLSPARTLKGGGPDPDRDAGADVEPHRGSIAWNVWRKRWVTVFGRKGGSSPLGEIWYAEADSPLGPWGPAVRVLSHEKQTFYNPRLHPEFTPAGSPILLFEGTYTISFSGNDQPTPRYEYNQVLYRLDLDDPRLASAHTPPPLDGGSPVVALCREMLFRDDLPDAAVAEFHGSMRDESYRVAVELLFGLGPKPAPAAGTPVLVVGGGRDRAVRRADVERVARWHGTEAVLFDESPHDLMLSPGWEKPADHIASWLGDRLGFPPRPSPPPGGPVQTVP
jgi:hypothetical protein